MGLIIDEIQGSGQLKIGQNGMTGTRIARCLWPNWPATVLALMGTPVFYGGFVQVIGRESWPGIPGLMVDSVDVEPMGKMLASNWYDGPNYDYAKLTINYKVDEHQEDENENGELGSWLVEKLDYSVEVAVVPVQVVDQADQEKIDRKAKEEYEKLLSAPSSDEHGNPVPPPKNPGLSVAKPVAKKKTVKRYIRIPTVTYSVTLPRVPKLPGKEIQAAIGKINKSSIFGGKPGTVLFDGPSAERESIFFSQRFWRVEYKFIYQPNGWNNTLHPDTLKWVAAKGVGSDNDPHEFYDLKELFPAPYKVSS